MFIEWKLSFNEVLQSCSILANIGDLGYPKGSLDYGVYEVLVIASTLMSISSSIIYTTIFVEMYFWVCCFIQMDVTVLILCLRN